MVVDGGYFSITKPIGKILPPCAKYTTDKIYIPHMNTLSDILLETRIFSLLGWADLISLSEVCKRFDRILAKSNLWFSFYKGPSFTGTFFFVTNQKTLFISYLRNLYSMLKPRPFLPTHDFRYKSVLNSCDNRRIIGSKRFAVEAFKIDSRFLCNYSHRSLSLYILCAKIDCESLFEWIYSSLSTHHISTIRSLVDYLMMNGPVECLPVISRFLHMIRNTDFCWWNSTDEFIRRDRIAHGMFPVPDCLKGRKRIVKYAIEEAASSYILDCVFVPELMRYRKIVCRALSVGSIEFARHLQPEDFNDMSIFINYVKGTLERDEECRIPPEMFLNRENALEVVQNISKTSSLDSYFHRCSDSTIDDLLKSDGHLILHLPLQRLLVNNGSSFSLTMNRDFDIFRIMVSRNRDSKELLVFYLTHLQGRIDWSIVKSFNFANMIYIEEVITLLVSRLKYKSDVLCLMTMVGEKNPIYAGKVIEMKHKLIPEHVFPIFSNWSFFQINVIGRNKDWRKMMPKPLIRKNWMKLLSTNYKCYRHFPKDMKEDENIATFAFISSPLNSRFYRGKWTDFVCYVYMRECAERGSDMTDLPRAVVFSDYDRELYSKLYKRMKKRIVK